MARRQTCIAACVCAYVLFCALYYLLFSGGIFSKQESSSSEDWNVAFRHRKLLNVHQHHHPNWTAGPLNCSPADIEQFPRPLLDNSARLHGGLLLHILATLYMFLGLAILCDEYFVPSLEKICDVLHIQSDVAGATFMAAGSSAPELATAVIAVFIAQDDIGIGTVVGSAVFNIAFVIGICGLYAGRTVPLNWWPMVRDCTFYFISILALLFALRDDSVTWVESVLFLSLYTAYILFMFANARVEAWLGSLPCLSRFAPDSSPKEASLYHPLPDMPVNGHKEKLLPDTSTDVPRAEFERGTLTPPPGCFRKSLWAASLPLLLLCYFTVPDCRKSRWERWFMVTFVASCAWIGLLSYVLVWMITIIGYTCHIKDTIMGLTFLAAGASIPDAISSLLVVREGLGDMAVSNAVGSNVFDILLCLGFPWFLQTVVIEPGSKIIVKSRGLTYSTLTLLLTVVFLLLATHLNGWKLDRKYGTVLLLWYALFMVVAILYESNLLGDQSLPVCPSDY